MATSAKKINHPLRIITHGNDTFKSKELIIQMGILRENNLEEFEFFPFSDISLNNRSSARIPNAEMSRLIEELYQGVEVSAILVLIRLTEIFSEGMRTMIQKLPHSKFYGYSQRNEKEWWKHVIIVFSMGAMEERNDKQVMRSIETNMGIKQIVKKAGNRYICMSDSTEPGELVQKLRDVMQSMKEKLFLGGTRLPGYNEKMDSFIHCLNNGRAGGFGGEDIHRRFIIFGEKQSGKSSLANLLLGRPVFSTFWTKLTGRAKGFPISEADISELIVDGDKDTYSYESKRIQVVDQPESSNPKLYGEYLANCINGIKCSDLVTFLITINLNSKLLCQDEFTKINDSSVILGIGGFDFYSNAIIVFTYSDDFANNSADNLRKILEMKLQQEDHVFLKKLLKLVEQRYIFLNAVNLGKTNRTEALRKISWITTRNPDQTFRDENDQPKEDPELNDQPNEDPELNDQPKEDPKLNDQPKRDPEPYNQPKRDPNPYYQPKRDPEPYNQPKRDPNPYYQPNEDPELNDQPKEDPKLNDQPKRDPEPYNQPKRDPNPYYQPKRDPEPYNQPKRDPNPYYQPKRDPEPYNQPKRDPNPYYQPNEDPELNDQPKEDPKLNDQPKRDPEPYNQPKRDPNPYYQPKRDPEPYNQPKRDPNPYYQPKRDPEPYNQPKRDPNPYYQPKRDPEPYNQPKRDPEPYNQPKRDPEPYNQPKRDPEPYNQPKRDPNPYYQPKRDPELNDQPKRDPEPYNQPKRDPNPYYQPKRDPELNDQPKDDPKNKSKAGIVKEDGNLVVNDKVATDGLMGLSQREKGKIPKVANITELRKRFRSLENTHEQSPYVPSGINRRMSNRTNTESEKNLENEAVGVLRLKTNDRGANIGSREGRGNVKVDTSIQNISDMEELNIGKKNISFEIVEALKELSSVINTPIRIAMIHIREDFNKKIYANILKLAEINSTAGNKVCDWQYTSILFKLSFDDGEFVNKTIKENSYLRTLIEKVNYRYACVTERMSTDEFSRILKNLMGAKFQDESDCSREITEKPNDINPLKSVPVLFNSTNTTEPKISKHIPFSFEEKSELIITQTNSMMLTSQMSEVPLLSYFSLDKMTAAGADERDGQDPGPQYSN